jgi:hypothetical protein
MKNILLVSFFIVVNIVLGVFYPPLLAVFNWIFVVFIVILVAFDL